MADIDVVKKGSRAWIWILLAIAIVVLFWLFMMGGDTTTQQIGLHIGDGGQPQYAAALVNSPAAA